ncbi:hypothetical protein Cfor_04905 [Coptotermes formosanus]|jgi:hypothetical protein|uniref:RNase H type-1 domain-containing protein n=1 Tax=Coptotermes formosanus TaxID=36987 RepID=A0A6L2PSB0_COPFO|nr:hypothetical protein Cfor_04905 [Coptotermes formosanus]
MALEVLSANCPVSLVWVPGHAGIKGNEKADVLAKKGAGGQFIVMEPVLGISTWFIRQGIINWMTNKHPMHWKSMSGSQRQAQLEGPHMENKTILLLFLSRMKIRSVSRLLTGHNTLRRHLHVIGLIADPACRFFGLKEESSNHVLCFSFTYL